MKFEDFSKKKSYDGTHLKFVLNVAISKLLAFDEDLGNSAFILDILNF